MIRPASCAKDGTANAKRDASSVKTHCERPEPAKLFICFLPKKLPGETAFNNPGLRRGIELRSPQQASGIGRLYTQPHPFVSDLFNVFTAMIFSTDGHGNSARSFKPGWVYRKQGQHCFLDGQ